MSPKQSIVDRIESKFSVHIFDGQYHIDECRCPSCINRLWDALVIKSENILQEMRKTFGE